MRALAIRGLAFAGLLTITSATQAQSSFWGGNDQVPSLNIAPATLRIDVPMPVSGDDLQLMLAQAANGGGLADLKQEAVRTYTQHLQGELTRLLHDHLEDERIPLVKQEGVLTLQNDLKLKVIKHLSAMKPKGDYDLEQGNVALSGEFHYLLKHNDGTTLQEKHIALRDLGITSKYRVRNYRDGRTNDDNTEEAIKDALSKLAEELMESLEDDLEADKLREIAAR
ncbi:hypothetical protein PVT68_11820 [Microbulbifer bruguierae]|uniref:Uncharacterized protein n=1 Tax=Microbulbifer bruguierae TaxID=3029061 RepID=A0ABY8N985_9GAMM|nr:hypothetical protein [Microbulbifer bruguierae]WGL15456.1 hypothetical protein PVT68_11820 [Microbulbifer bruguierae]